MPAGKLGRSLAGSLAGVALAGNDGDGVPVSVLTWRGASLTWEGGFLTWRA